VLFGDFVESQSKDLKDSIDEGESGEDYGYWSDSDLEDDEDGRVTSLKHASKSKVQSTPLPVTPGEDKIPREDYEERVEKGKVVKIPDMAFIT
jgi:hypothetical protein